MKNEKVLVEIIFEGQAISIYKVIQMIRHLDYSSLEKVTFKRPKKINGK